MVCKAQTRTADSLWARQLADSVLLHDYAYENLRHLTKKIGHRLSGSSALVKAEEWGFQVLQKAGADTVYYQTCHIPAWKRDPDAYALLKLKNGKTVKLEALDLGNSAGTGGREITLPLVRVSNWTELTALGKKIAGKAVFFDVPFEENLVEPFQSYGKNAGYRTEGPSRAAALGARAVLVRSMTHNHLNNEPHTGTLRYNDSFPSIPAMALGLESTARLRKELLAGPEALLILKSSSRMYDSVEGRNVVAELRGKVWPRSYITLGGHLDSWDLGEGAHDDGAGIVHTVEVLRALKAVGYRPEHTLRFVFFTNEENGTRGAKKYAEEAKKQGEKHVFALESDAGGFTPRGFGITGSDLQLALFQQYSWLLDPYLGGKISAGGGGSDIAPLRTLLGTALAGLKPDGQRYFDLHHTRNDVLEAVHPRELKLGALNMALLLYIADKYVFAP